MVQYCTPDTAKLRLKAIVSIGSYAWLFLQDFPQTDFVC